MGLLLREGENTVCVTEIVGGCSTRMAQGGEDFLPPSRVPSGKGNFLDSGWCLLQKLK